MQTTAQPPAAPQAARPGASRNPSPIRPFESSEPVAPRSRLDELVFRRLKARGITPSRLCSDEVFARRAYLDALGTLPTAQEARAFAQETGPNRRRALVERLLGREEFADYQAMRWADILRIKAEFPINLWPDAAQAYHRWIRDSLRRNVPCDRLVREMLTASGSNFRVPPVNFYRAVEGRKPEDFARAVALTFMGTRAEKWPKRRLAGMAAFFSQITFKATGEWKEEIVLFDPTRPSAGTPPRAAFPDGRPARLTPGQDPRAVFAAWLTAPGNPWFARSLVNRLWAWLLGRGIVHEPDDLRPDNPPRNPELLAWLERELVNARFDLRHIYRLILNSTTYQLSFIPRSSRPDAEAEFACYPLRRLDAEVLIDALNQITGASESYTSAVPEPFTFLPDGQRAVAIADGSITSPFLEMFGRPTRDTGLESERNNRPSAAQRLHLLNSSHIRRKIEQSPALLARFRQSASAQQLVEELYLTILSRRPTDEERKIVESYARPGASMRWSDTVDLAWALINSAEFLYRH